MIELLESRIAPALLVPIVTKGVLTIAHDPASSSAESISVTQTGPDAFTVSDTLAGTDFGNFSGVKSIKINVSDLGDTMTLGFSSDGLAGKLAIAMTGGTNTITLQSAGAGAGRILGAVTIEGGAGADTVNIFGGLAIASKVLFDGHLGIDAFKPNGAYLAGKLTLESVENITVEPSSAPVVIGGMLVENEDADGPVSFVLSNVAMVAGTLTYCGSETVSDTVTLNGQFAKKVNMMLFGGQNSVTAAGTFSSTLLIAGGAGDDTVKFNAVSLSAPPGAAPFITATLNGALIMKLGNGTNSVTLQDGSLFSKGLSLTAGTGTDTVNFTRFNALGKVSLSLGHGANSLNGTGANLITGAFSYTGGVDADTVALGSLITGTLNVKLGDGANSVTGSARVLGKTASFTGGAGVDTLNFSLASTTASLKAKVGGGNDSLKFNGGALASATLNGGTGSDSLQGSGLLPVKRKLSGFETTM